MTELPPELQVRVAAGRLGLQRRDAVAQGMSDTHLRRWCASGLMESLGFGAYLIRAPLQAQNRFEQERELHLRRAEAVLGGLPGAYLVGRSAAWAWGAPLLKAPTHVELARRPRLRTERSHITSRAAWGRGPSESHPTRQHPAEVAVDVAARDGVAAGSSSRTRWHTPASRWARSRRQPIGTGCVAAPIGFG